MQSQYQIPAGMENITIIFDQLSTDKKKTVEAYGLGLLHGMQIEPIQSAEESVQPAQDA